MTSRSVQMAVLFSVLRLVCIWPLSLLVLRLLIHEWPSQRASVSCLLSWLILDFGPMLRRLAVVYKSRKCSPPSA